MKELSMEEKAKAYDEAIERARNWKEKSGMPKDRQGILDDIFPELQESKDERIRKALIKYFHGFLDGYEDTYKIGGCVKWEGLDVKDVIDWLEKQKTSEEALQYLKENHSPSEVSDFQAAMNIAVAKAYNKGYNDGLEKQGEHANFRNKIQIGDKVTRNIDGVLINLSQLNRVAKKRWKPNEQDVLLLERIFDGTLNPKDFQASLQNIIEQLKKLKD